MKKLLNPTAHGVLDYLMVAIFAVAPTILKLGPMAAKVSYALAAIHLLLTIFTAFPLGLVKKIPFPYHGMVEFYVSVVLVAFGVFFLQGVDRIFFIVVGVVIFVTFMVTEYREMLVPASSARES